MKKLFLIAVMLFAVATAQAQTQTDENPPKLPANLSENMTIEQVNRNTIDATLTITFNRHLTENEIELVKAYVLYHYDWKQPIGNKYNPHSPDIFNNQKKRCTLKFYKQ
jgi:hypothetical protein